MTLDVVTVIYGAEIDRLPVADLGAARAEIRRLLEMTLGADEPPHVRARVGQLLAQAATADVGAVVHFDDMATIAIVDPASEPAPPLHNRSTCPICGAPVNGEGCTVEIGHDYDEDPR